MRARDLLRPARTVVSESQRKHAAQVLPHLEEIVLRTQDGLALRGWFSPGRRGDAVVLVHGQWGNRAQLLPEAELLSRRGHGVLLYDSRCSGESDGDLSTWGDRERLDARAAVDFLAARPGVDASRLGIYGFSVGASTAALSGAADRRLHAVALGPTWTSLDDELSDKFQSWGLLSSLPARLSFRLGGVDVGAVRPIDVVGSIAPRPLLLFSATADWDTPLPVMDRIAQRAPTAERWTMVSAEHGGYATFDPAGLDAHFGGFFDRALGDAAAAMP